MLVNADFSVRAVLAAQDGQWTHSPQAGVSRVMLDRIGEEKARATSLVKYQAASWFPGHSHPGGEEILVLSGTFSEGARHYPEGWYMRNPPRSSHQPSSAEGAVIFVKLWQMPFKEHQPVRIDTTDASAWTQAEDRSICRLFDSDYESVSLQRTAPLVALLPEAHAGAEVLVLAGEAVLDGQSYPRGSWMRFPATDLPALTAGPDGVSFYLKTGHLPGVAHTGAVSWMARPCPR